MTTTTFPMPHTLGGQLLTRIRSASPAVWFTILAFSAATLLCLGLQMMDERLVNGINTWVKPTKFFVSLAVQLATVAWAIQFLSDADRRSWGIRWSVGAMVAAAWIEMVYIVFRAARAEPSHFFVSTPFASFMYTVMGIGAVTLTFTAGYIGYRIWRTQKGLWPEAAALGLMAGAVLGTLAGAYVSAQTGHSVGGDPTDVTGTGLFSWSTTGGDLRIAHFVGLHAAQIVPFAALSGRRDVVWLTFIASAVLTAGTFVLAILGIPLLQAA
jgi:hypothetical protein